MMERQFGNVCYAGIDVDQDLKYPKGAGRVTFSDQTSYVAAISAKFVQLRIGEISKKVIQNNEHIYEKIHYTTI